MIKRRHTKRVRIGTSGWSYPHWRGPFYPLDLSPTNWLDFYASRFDTVQVDSTFYRLPASHTIRGWIDSVPKRFSFAVKASAYITHMKKLSAPKSSTRPFLQRIADFGDRLGPILFQLPPRWHADPGHLERFLQGLSRDFRYVFEFRDHTWVSGAVFDVLAQHRAAFCIYELGGYSTPPWSTTDFAYIRLHGPRAAYRGCYGARRLAEWARTLEKWAAQGCRVFCYFDNDERAYATRNAATLRAQLEG